jgi:DNA polymerase-1
MDASAFIHRAFHAVREMATMAGVPTGAAFGFTGTLLKLLRETKPNYLGVVFDSRGKTRRHEIYGEYKANRPPMDPNLANQLEPIKKIVESLGLTTLEKPGFEADDIIASLCGLAVSENRPVVIVSGDKDFYQLLSPTVSMYDPSPNKNSAMTLESFKERFGIEPAAFLDVQALMGDSSDNIPGVPKVGEVTALKLISEWGSLDNLYQNLPRITKNAVRLTLTENEASARLSKTLAKLGEGLEPIVPIEDLKPRNWNAKTLFSVFSFLEFNRFARELEASGPVWLNQDRVKLLTPSKPAVNRLFGPGSLGYEAPDDKIKAVLVDSPEAWAKLEEALTQAQQDKGAVGLAYELKDKAVFLASGRDSGALVGLSLAATEDLGFYVPINHKNHKNQPQRLVLEKLSPFFSSNKPLKFAHGSKALGHALAALGGAAGPEGAQIFDCPVEDPMLASYLINPDDKNDLPALSSKYLDRGLKTLAEATGVTKKPDPALMAPTDLLKHSVKNAAATLELQRKLEGELKKDPALEELFYLVELPLSEVLRRVEEAGVLLDPKVLREVSDGFAKSLAERAQIIYRQAGREFNLGSPKQTADVLFEDLKIPTIKKTAKKTFYSTDNEVLTELALIYPIARDILIHRELSKLKNTYADKLPLSISPITKRVHTTYNQALAVTGRLSSSEPNLQNIPTKSEEGRRIRAAFMAAPGHYLVSADYSQIELRIMAHFSHDRTLLDAFLNDEDIHAQTAAQIFGLRHGAVTQDARRQAKTINFGVIYGQGAFGLSRALNITFQEANNFINRYFERFPGVRKYMDTTRWDAKKNGFVTTWYGRKRYLPGLKSSHGPTKRESERMAINTPIQGTAADVIKMAMIQVDRALADQKLKARVIIQVHDELVLEVPQDELETVSRLVAREMNAVGQNPLLDSARPLDVNLKVDVAHGRAWVHA